MNTPRIVNSCVARLSSSDMVSSTPSTCHASYIWCCSSCLCTVIIITSVSIATNIRSNNGISNIRKQYTNQYLVLCLRQLLWWISANNQNRNWFLQCRESNRQCWLWLTCMGQWGRKTMITAEWERWWPSLNEFCTGLIVFVPISDQIMIGNRMYLDLVVNGCNGWEWWEICCFILEFVGVCWFDDIIHFLVLVWVESLPWMATLWFSSSPSVIIICHFILGRDQYSG